MTVHYQTYARFVEFFGKEGDVDVTPDLTVQGLLEHISGDDEKKRSLLFDDSGAVRRYVILLKNKERIQNEDAGTTLIHDGDEIILYPPVSGG